MRHRTRPVPVSSRGPRGTAGATSRVAPKKLSKPVLVSRGTAEKIYGGISLPRRRARRAFIEPLLLLLPAGLFGLRPLFESLRLLSKGAGPLYVFSLGLVQRRLRLVDRLLPACALLLPGRLLPGFFALATPTLPFVRLCGLPLRRLVRLGRSFPRLGRGLRAAFFRPSWPRFFGSSAFSPKGPSDPTGRLRTTPGFAMVAAMTSGSWLSIAAP